MSHWIELPWLLRVWDLSVVWSAEFTWSLSSHNWLSSEELSLELRRYPGDQPSSRVQLQLFSETFRVWEASRLSWSDSSRPLAELNAYLEANYAR